MSTLISSLTQWQTYRRNHGRHEIIDNSNLVDDDEEILSNRNNNNNNVNNSNNNSNDNSNNEDDNVGDSVNVEAAETRRTVSSSEQNENLNSNAGETDVDNDNNNNNNNINNLREADEPQQQQQQVDEESGPDESTQVRFAVQQDEMINMNEERELMRRRNFACNAFLVIVLARLWIQAYISLDPGLLIICLFTTSWAVKWIRMRIATEQAMDRRLEQYYASSNDAATPRGRTIDTMELSLMSFQSQLAMAILESQRQMMENGGYGRPDDTVVSEGVSEQAKSSWNSYPYQPSSSLPLKLVDEQPSCSVCLCEYEPGDQLIQLPCKHIYHEDCITAWCNNHKRCPLCNLDLESNNHE